MGGSAKSTSDASQHQTTTTKTWTDSFNTTVNRVNNLSNVGNVSVAYPGIDDASGFGTVLPVVAIGAAAIVAMVLFRRG